jgi:NAD+ kinase
MRVVLIHRPQHAAALAVAKRLEAWLEQRGVETELRSAADPGAPPTGAELAICLGGEGTVLHVAHFLGGRPVPLVPIKMGTVNFLGEIEPDELPAALEPYLAGDFWLDERAMLAARTSEGGEGARRIGLNDAVLTRAETARVAHIEVVVNQTAMTCYAGDGVIVSTATGSTAYSLAAGGPVLTPQSCCLIITAVAPQFSSLRSLVVPETAHVRLVNRGPCPLRFGVDGELGQHVAPGRTLKVEIAPERCSFARRGSREAFYRGLAARLGRKLEPLAR